MAEAAKDSAGNAPVAEKGRAKKKETTEKPEKTTKTRKSTKATTTDAAEATTREDDYLLQVPVRPGV